MKITERNPGEERKHMETVYYAERRLEYEKHNCVQQREDNHVLPNLYTARTIFFCCHHSLFIYFFSPKNQQKRKKKREEKDDDVISSVQMLH